MYTDAQLGNPVTGVGGKGMDNYAVGSSIPNSQLDQNLRTYNPGTPDQFKVDIDAKGNAVGGQQRVTNAKQQMSMDNINSGAVDIERANIAKQGAGADLSQDYTKPQAVNTARAMERMARNATKSPAGGDFTQLANGQVVPTGSPATKAGKISFDRPDGTAVNQEYNPVTGDTKDLALEQQFKDRAAAAAGIIAPTAQPAPVSQETIVPVPAPTSQPPVATASKPRDLLMEDFKGQVPTVQPVNEAGTYTELRDWALTDPRLDTTQPGANVVNNIAPTPVNIKPNLSRTDSLASLDKAGLVPTVKAAPSLAELDALGKVPTVKPMTDLASLDKAGLVPTVQPEINASYTPEVTLEDWK
jgi:hypothetical protein